VDGDGAPEGGEIEGADTGSDEGEVGSEGGSGPENAPGEGGPRKKRRRRRGRRSGDRQRTGTDPDATGPQGDGGGPEADVDADDGDEDDAESGAHAPARRRNAKPVADVANWDEVFESLTFADLGLRTSVLKGVEAVGFKHPTKIQADLIPLVISGKDVLGQSRTGTGKTAAFVLPLFNMLERGVPFQVIVLAPTRELAIQIAEEARELGRFTPVRVTALYGGQSIQTQLRELEDGPEIIVATPGRLIDMVDRRALHFDSVKIAVLDEVDRMLDIGFRDDIRKILGRIRQPHQTVFVSATISEEIERLARSYMKDPVKLVTQGSSLTVSLVEQHYISVQPWDKRTMLLHVLTHEEPDLTIVFCRMKRTVDNVAKYLSDKGIDAHAIHGDMYQSKRNSVMTRLRSGKLSVIVASDLASRGLDVDGITHVINYDIPEDPEIYVHRIGRTARAGRHGVAWTFVTPEQGPLLTAVEHLANIHIPEKTYPAFKPGSVPSDVAAQRERDQKRVEKLQERNRFQGPSLPMAASAASETGSTGRGEPAKVDASKFPGGLVPTKLPPNRMGGRMRTSRS
jgi:ATP-dependent RNA helicase DeaD